MTKKLSNSIKARVRGKKNHMMFLKRGLTWKYIYPQSLALARKQA